MRKILYHGSLEIISTPMYGQGKVYNDYGQGFYCTESLELAKVVVRRAGGRLCESV